MACKKEQPANPEANTCLYSAVETGDVLQVDSCLGLGADVNLRDEFGAGLLHVAVRQRNPKIVQQLLKAGAAPDLRRSDYYFSTPLMETAVVDDVESAELLLGNKASLLLRDSFGDMALHWAVFYGRESLTKLFLKNGADFSAESQQGNILEIALRNHDTDLLRCVEEELSDQQINQLLRGKATEKETKLGIPLLCLAAARGDINRLEKSNKNEWSQLDPVGQSLLTYAAAENQVEVVKWALAHVISPGWGSNEEGLFPLSLAAEHGHLDVLKLLVEAGAKIDPPRRFTGYTPLMLAVKKNHLEVVRYLLTAGADINARGLDGATISDMLAFAPNSQMEQLLQAHLAR